MRMFELKNKKRAKFKNGGTMIPLSSAQTMARSVPVFQLKNNMPNGLYIFPAAADSTAMRMFARR